MEASRLAVTKAQNSEVKAFAEKLIADHTKAADEVKSLVARKHAEWKVDDPAFLEKKNKHASLQDTQPELREHLKMARDLRAKLFK